MSITVDTCLEALRWARDKGVYRGEQIGRVVDTVNGMVGSHATGSIVIVSEGYAPTYIISSPMPPERRIPPSLLFDWGTVVGVPRRLVEIIDADPLGDAT